MKKLITSLMISMPVLAGAQTLYVPGGTGGIGASTNANVGIGINTPSTKLQVYGGALQVINTDTYSGIYLDAPAVDQPKIGWRVSDNSERFRIHLQGVNTGTERLAFYSTISGQKEVFSVLANGNVGVGTSTPGHRLEVTETSGTPSLGIKGNFDSKIIFEPSDGSDRFTIWSDMDGNTYQDLLRFGAVNAPDILTLKGDGNVGIGTTTPDAKLTVKGDIHTREVRVDMSGPLQGPDYVFEKDYDLLSLSELEAYINQNKHLPEVPSAKEMEANGLNLKEMNLLLLKKVEELTLHLIDQQKEIKALKSDNTELKKLVREIHKK